MSEAIELAKKCGALVPYDGTDVGRYVRGTYVFRLTELEAFYAAALKAGIQRDRELRDVGW